MSLFASLQEREEGDGGEIYGEDVGVECVRSFGELLLEELVFQFRSFVAFWLNFWSRDTCVGD
jgi:hypothetical protein